MLYTLKKKFGNMKAILPQKENPLNQLNLNQNNASQKRESQSVSNTINQPTSGKKISSDK